MGCVCVGACMLAELTCIPYSGLRQTLWIRCSALDCVCVCVCRCLHACIPYSGLRRTLWVRSSALDCVFVCRCLHACVHVVYIADLYTVFGPKADIVGQVLGPRLCVCVCVHVCVRPTICTSCFHETIRKSIFQSCTIF